MDIFQTTVLCIHEICRITIFIRKVVHDIKTYDDDVSQLQAELEHEFVFLETFKKLFFEDDKNEFRQFRYLPDNLTRSVNHILTGLNKCLAEYRVVALKHGLDLSEADAAMGYGQQTLTIAASPSTSTAPTSQVAVSDSYRDRFKTMVTSLRLKAKAPEWALFSKSKIQALLEQYSLWTERLRQVMTLMLLVEGRVGSLSVSEIATHSAGSALGLQKTAARQLRAHTDPPADFDSLDGTFQSLDAVTSASPLQYVVGTYTDAFGVSSTTVIMEKHTFDIFDSAVTSSSEKEALRKNLVRKLAWTLRDGDASSRSSKAISSPAIATNSPEMPTVLTERQSHVSILPCLGYLPVGKDGYSSIIYSLPAIKADASIRTLHDYILNYPRPALGDRFTMALSLAQTIFHIHSSGWVHKNIRSRAIIITPMSGKTLLYLLGWSTARPRTEQMNIWSMESQEKTATSSVDRPLEQELYRHPERYETITAAFTAKHDIYSVGIVLLEIALWTTMSKQFASPIAKAQEKGALPPVDIVSKALSKLSRDHRVAQEMGEGYARLIRRCLETDFEVGKHDEQESGLLGQFQALVVDKLSLGVAM
ncbi:uncharacterized protein BDV14DRAFT_175570 [Aspergillus stella-maris]|uniref:uncharacterized protein n=1 Tax=Aspergillus stella-maris TaxID=1810926 RepID=UPI003CCCC87A